MKQCPKVGISSFEEFVTMVVDDGCDAVGNVLVINYKMCRRVALIGPEGRTKLCTAYSLTSRNGARR